MKATEAKLLDFLKKSPQFVIPIYQRTYSWAEPECSQLWEDILRAGGNDDISACCQSAKVGRIGTRENYCYGEPALSSLAAEL